MPAPHHDVKDQADHSSPLQLKESLSSGRSASPPPFSMGGDDVSQRKEGTGGGGTSQMKSADITSTMGEALGANFDNVTVKQNSSEAKNNGAIAFARGGNEVHTAGSLDLSKTEDRNTAGEEFHHIKQQRTQTIKPTGVTEGGMPVNDSPKLEGEAKDVGKQMESNSSLNQIASGSGASSGGSGAAAQAKMADQTMQLNDGENDTVSIQSGMLTTLGEGNSESNAYVHRPNTPSSGPTIGQGYDIGSRTREEIIADTTAAGFPLAQAQALAEGAGLKGAAAETWTAQNRSRVGRMTSEVQSALLAQQLPTYTENAQNLATSETATQDRNGFYTNARGREVNDGVDAGTYVMTDDQWDALHPAMIEFLTDLKYQGGYYLYDRIAQINKKLIANHGNHIEQFRAVITLWESSNDNLSYMDNYGSRIGEGTGNTETFFDQDAAALEGASTRRNRIRLAYLKKVLDALLCGQEVVMEGGENGNTDTTTSDQSLDTENLLPPASDSSSGDGNTTAIGTGTVKADRLNVRSGPGTTHNPVGKQLESGGSVTIYEAQGKWLRIGSNQWVSGDFIERAAAEAEGNTSPISSGSVNATLLNIRSGPGTNNGVVGDGLPSGAPVQIYEESNGWYRIGENQWVSAQFITQAPVAPTPIGSGTISASKLNVRSGPGTSNATVGDPLPNGAEVSFFEERDGWLKIGDGKWVSAEFVNTGTQEETTPVAEEDTDTDTDTDTGSGSGNTTTTPDTGNADTPVVEVGSDRGVTLEASVGTRGKNNSADVTKVQQLLKRIGFNIGVDGGIGKETKGAIHAFQYEMMSGYHDGRVDPGGTTLGLLNTTADGAFANTKDELDNDNNAPRLTHNTWRNKDYLTTDGAGQTIPKPSYDNMSKLIQQMNIIGDALSRDLHVNSGYRSPKYNSSLEGSATASNHQFGQAVDISSNYYSPQTIGDTIVRLMNEGKIHKGGLGWYNSFIHYDVGAHRSWDNR